MDKSHQIFFESLHESLERVEQMIAEYITTTKPLLADTTTNHQEIILRTLLLDNHMSKTMNLVDAYRQMAPDMLLRYVEHSPWDGLYRCLREDLIQHMVLLVSCYKDGNPNVVGLAKVGALNDMSVMIAQKDKEILKETIELASQIAEGMECAETVFAAMDNDWLAYLLQSLFDQYERDHEQDLVDFANENEYTTIKELKDDYVHERLVKMYITKKNNLGEMVRQMRVDGCVMADLEPLCAYVIRYRYLQKHGRQNSPQIVEIVNPAQVNITTAHEVKAAPIAHSSELPEELATAEAMKYWERLQQEGIVDQHFQPLCSRSEMALLAYEMAKRLAIENMWSVFGEFWQKKYLSTEYSKAKSLQKRADYLKMLKEKIFS